MENRLQKWRWGSIALKCDALRQALLVQRFIGMRFAVEESRAK